MTFENQSVIILYNTNKIRRKHHDTHKDILQTISGTDREK